MGEVQQRTSHIRPITIRGSHTLIIGDFLSKVKTSQKASCSKTYKSAKFSLCLTNSDKKVGFQIVLDILCEQDYDEDEEEEESGAIYVSLHHLPSEMVPVQSQNSKTDKAENKIPVKCQFEILDDDYKILQKSEKLEGCFSDPGTAITIHQFELDFKLNLHEVLRKPTDFLKADNTLVVRCWVEIDCGTELVMDSTMPIDPETRLNRRLSPEMYPDLYLASGESRLPCHKHMLAACSDVFNAMFLHDTNEVRSNEVIIKDVDPKALKKLLEFVYTDDIKDFEGMADKLISAADKYNITSLKTIAINEAVRKLTVLNVGKFINLTSLVRSQYLKNEALTYAKEHIDEIMETEGWMSLSPESIKSLFETAAKYGKI